MNILKFTKENYIEKHGFWFNKSEFDVSKAKHVRYKFNDLNDAYYVIKNNTTYKLEEVIEYKHVDPTLSRTFFQIKTILIDNEQVEHSRVDDFIVDECFKGGLKKRLTWFKEMFNNNLHEFKKPVNSELVWLCNYLYANLKLDALTINGVMYIYVKRYNPGLFVRNWSKTNQIFFKSSEDEIFKTYITVDIDNKLKECIEFYNNQRHTYRYSIDLYDFLDKVL